MQLGDVCSVLALRLAPPLALGAAACAWLARAGWPAARVLGLVAPLLLCAVAPASPQVGAAAAVSLAGGAGLHYRALLGAAGRLHGALLGPSAAAQPAMRL